MVHKSYQPIGSFMWQVYYFGHDISSRLQLRPVSCVCGYSSAEFLSFIKRTFALILYTRYCFDWSFLTHVEALDVILIVSLLGVTTTIMTQFDQTQTDAEFMIYGIIEYLLVSLKNSLGRPLLIRACGKIRSVRID